MIENDIILNVVKLKKYFPVKKRGLLSFSRRRDYVRAIDDISFNLEKSEILGLAGESGCGKTTTGRVILRLTDPTAGEVFFKGINLFSIKKREFKNYRRQMQMIFQDPYESLNPRRTVEETIRQPIEIHNLVQNEDEKKDLIFKTLEEVELKPPTEFLNRYPHMLSGGQRQRLAISRAIVLRPKIIIADEPVSMLDVSTRSGILSLIEKLRKDMEISYIYITHDLATAKYICDRVAIMYLGKIVEIGATKKIITEPLHPYTQALISAVPVPDPKTKIGEIPIKGEVPLNQIEIISGCRFHPRCPIATERCRKDEPGLSQAEGDHHVACYLNN